jgi:hypothetical protein
MSTTSYGERVRSVLQTAVRTSGVRQGTIERALGMSKGYLSQVFSGRIELKVWHLEVILEQIGFDPQAFFRLVYPRPGEDEGTTMEQFAAYASRHPRHHPAALGLPPELRVAIQEMVRDALAAQQEDDGDGDGDGNGAEGPEPAGKRGSPRRRPAGGRRKPPSKK